MRKKKIALTLALASFLSFGVISDVSCGGGGGGGGTYNNNPNNNPSAPQNMSNGLSTNIYSSTDALNQPYVYVYVDNQPVPLVMDTGASGMVVNQSAVNIPQKDYTSYTFSAQFGDGSVVSGTIASATVCINPSIAASCVVMPIGVNTNKSSSNAFPSSGEMQGDFGLGSGYNSIDIGMNSYGTLFYWGLSYPYYLEKATGIDSYTFSIYPLQDGYYADYPSSQTIGILSFGNYQNQQNQNLIVYNDGANGFPSTTAAFNSLTALTYFDTGSGAYYLSTNALSSEIPDFSAANDEGACVPYYGSGFSSVVNGGYTISYSINSYTFSYTTLPTTAMCSNYLTFNMIEGLTIDAGNYGYGEGIGFPAFYSHTFTWILGTPGSSSQGFVQYVNIQ